MVEESIVEKIKSLKDQGNLCLWKKNYTEALKLFQEAIDIDPTNVELPLSKAATLNSLGKYEEAVKECELSLKLGDDRKNQVSKRGYEEDNEDLKKEEVIAKIEQIESRAYARMSAAYMGSGDYKKSRVCIVKAIETYNCAEFEEMLGMIDDLVRLSSTEASALYKQAKEMYKQGKYDDAIKAYTEVLIIDPHNNILLANRAMCLNKTLQFKHAILDADRSIEIQQKDKQFHYLPYYAKANGLIGLKKYNAALSMYQEAAKHCHHDPQLMDKKITKTKQLLEKRKEQRVRINEDAGSSSNGKGSNKKKNKSKKTNNNSGGGKGKKVMSKSEGKQPIKNKKIPPSMTPSSTLQEQPTSPVMNKEEEIEVIEGGESPELRSGLSESYGSSNVVSMKEEDELNQQLSSLNHSQASSSVFTKQSQSSLNHSQLISNLSQSNQIENDQQNIQVEDDEEGEEEEELHISNDNIGQDKEEQVEVEDEEEEEELNSNIQNNNQDQQEEEEEEELQISNGGDDEVESTFNDEGSEYNGSPLKSNKQQQQQPLPSS